MDFHISFVGIVSWSNYASNTKPAHNTQQKPFTDSEDQQRLNEYTTFEKAKTIHNMRIVQLSDIHLSADNLKDFQTYYLEQLIIDLNLFDKEKKIDIVVITGDLLDKGGNSFSHLQNIYSLFESLFISPISNSLKLDKSKFLFVPGNHDIQRDKIDEIYEQGLVNSILDINSSNSVLGNLRDKFTFANERIREFKEFEKKYHESTNSYMFSNNESVYIHEYDSLKIGFLLMNDSWRVSGAEKKGTHFVGINQLLNAKTIFQEKNTDVNLVLLHHPLSLFQQDEEQEIRNILQRFDFEIVLYGHTHKANVSLEFGTSGNVVFVNTKSAFNDPREKVDDFQPGYNIIDIDFTTLTMSCKFRKYYHNRYAFDADLGSVANGEFAVRVTPKGAKGEFYDLYSLSTKTALSHLDDYNNALILHKTNTIAPKDLNSIFVLPVITDKPISYQKKDDKRFTIEDILSEDKPLLILGSKEAGKTTLLNKISLDSAKLFSRYNLIAIPLEYKKFVKSDVLSTVRKYLNESKETVVRLAKEGKFLLLIDNYEFSELFSEAEKHLLSFMNTYPLNKIILTSSSDFDYLIEKEGTIVKSKVFKPIFIGSVGLKEFKELASKWFNTKDEEWHNENIKKLIKVFKILRIPRTFFAVSLYLWIIEKQNDFKPVNKNYLVNKFLQFILEGLIEEEGKAGAFNYDRKREILALVAFEMYSSGENIEGYSLSKSKIVSVINDYCVRNQRNYNPEDIFDLFHDKGIFKTYDSKIELDVKYCFRFESFFQFFLSFNIDTNEAFKKQIFEGGEILSFVDELEYYSGRNPSDRELLVHSMNLLDESFGMLDSFIHDETDGYLPRKLVLKDSTEINDDTVKKSKMTDREIENLHEKQLQNLPVNDSIAIKEKYNYKLYFHRMIELSAKVLKNAENIQDPSLINKSIDGIFSKTSKFGIFVHSILMSDHTKSELSGIDEVIPLDFIATFNPLFQESDLLQWMGTDFLQIPLKRKIEYYINSPNHKNHYEQFLSIFIYVDLKLPDYITLLTKTIKEVSHNYFLNLYFFKILSIYQRTPNRSALLTKYEELLKIILIKLKGLNRGQASERIRQDLKSLDRQEDDDLDE